jgi:hypothetical protein
MPTYRIGSSLGRTVAGRTPHVLVCEVCREELEGAAAEVERGQERFSGMTTAGVLRLWPSTEKVVKMHEIRCRGRLP